jgi:hypothetical protein
MRLLVPEGHGVVRAGIQWALESAGTQPVTRVERLQAAVVLFAAWES